MGSYRICSSLCTTSQPLWWQARELLVGQLNYCHYTSAPSPLSLRWLKPSTLRNSLYWKNDSLFCSFLPLNSALSDAWCAIQGLWVYVAFHCSNHTVENKQTPTQLHDSTISLLKYNGISWYKKGYYDLLWLRARSRKLFHCILLCLLS